jgi:hypothetical protein
MSHCLLLAYFVHYLVHGLYHVYQQHPQRQAILMHAAVLMHG